MAYSYNTADCETISILMSASGKSYKNVLSRIQTAFKEIYPDDIFEFQFFDQSLQRLYHKDIAIAWTMKWATGLAIFISCIGLMGLVNFTVNKRSREIAIRKVLGASMSQIIRLLSKRLLLLVFLAAVIASPMAWYVAHWWLESYAFKTTLNVGVFIGSLFILALLAFAVLYIRTFIAARSNPIVSLKTE